ncbi:unnamed protein product [Diamesa serratosioi]
MKKLTIVLVTFAVILVCSVVIFNSNLRKSHLSIHHEKYNQFEVNNITDNDGICKTESCVIAASKLHKRLNLDVNPCDNFYDFACGTFVDETVIHDRSKTYSTRTIIVEEIMEELRRLVTDKEMKDDIKPYVIVKEFYKLCFDRETIDKLGTSPLMKVIEKVGGWPILDQNWKEEEFRWSQTTDSLLDHGFVNDYLVEMSMRVDGRNKSKQILRIHQPFINYSYNDLYYDFLQEGLANDKIEAYFEYMMELTQALGATKDHSAKEMMDVLNFEISINKICAPYEDLRNETISYHYTTINELQHKYPYMNWLTFVRARIPKHIDIDDTEEILYMGTDFLEKFGILIDATPKRTVANYLFWRVADYSVDFLSKKIRLVKLKFHEKLSGTKSLDQGWKKCLTESVYNYKHAIGNLNFNESFGYYETSFDLFYFLKIKEYNILRENVASTQWEDINDINEVVSMFITINSFLTMPVAYLHSPFYSETAETYLNYAGIGVEAGYLIYYGVNNQLTALNSIEYQNKTRCFVEQYEKYLKDVHDLTRSADDIKRKLASGTASFKIAYEAYKETKVLNRNELKLPGLSYTTEQLFWIAAAQIYCNKNRPEELIRRVSGSSHALDQFIVVGSFQNIQEFSKDFKCLSSSVMNPVIRNSFFKYEIGCVTCEIDSSLQAKKDLEKLCEEVLRSSGVSIIARDVKNDEIVGVALNMIQVKPDDPDDLSYFEIFRDRVCRSDNAKSLMNYMINVDSKVNIFERYDVTALLEIMFLAVLPEYGRRGIGLNLCKFSVDLARELKLGKNQEMLSPEQRLNLPQLVSAIWTAKNSQKIGGKLGFECLHVDFHKNHTFNDKTYADRLGDASAVAVLAAKRL